jgi:hypothetical protein
MEKEAEMTYINVQTVLELVYSQREVLRRTTFITTANPAEIRSTDFPKTKYKRQPPHSVIPQYNILAFFIVTA